MSELLKQSTVYARKFLMVLASDHNTGYTGGTLPTVMLSKGTGAAGTAAAGVVTMLDSTNLPGMFQIALTTADTGVLGDLGFDCTAPTCDHTTFIDKVDTNIFSDLQLSAGRVLIANNLQQGQPYTLIFPMVNPVNGQLLPGLTVTGNRTLAGGGFALCTNSPATEVGGAGASGIYSLLLSATDTPAGTIGIVLTAPGATTQFAAISPTP